MRRWPWTRCHRAPLLLAAALAAALTGCNDRERIGIEPDNGGGGGGGGPGVGPTTVIEVPAEDTTVQAGPGLFVAGRVTDPDGVDSVYFDIQGGITRIPPYNHNGTSLMSFAIPISTSGQAGETIIVDVSGVDQAGNRGAPARRTITVE
ncbi:MAG TPA: hypothetical protein VLA95_00705 [Gemmatimonadales bacterium]|nr:hypothetical protein [Gemmatimonadales bacterium]